MLASSGVKGEGNILEEDAADPHHGAEQSSAWSSFETHAAAKWLASVRSVTKVCFHVRAFALQQTQSVMLATRERKEVFLSCLSSTLLQYRDATMIFVLSMARSHSILLKILEHCKKPEVLHLDSVAMVGKDVSCPEML